MVEETLFIKGVCMDLVKDLRALRKERSKEDSAKAQLRKRSKDSIARPKAKTNLFLKTHECRVYKLYK